MVHCSRKLGHTLAIRETSRKEAAISPTPKEVIVIMAILTIGPMRRLTLLHSMKRTKSRSGTISILRKKQEISLDVKSQMRLK